MADGLNEHLRDGRPRKARRVLVFPTVEEMARFVAGRFMEESAGAIATRGRFSVALSGGKTPVGPYREIAREAARGRDALDWGKVHVFLVDERFVPYHDDQSNYGMIRKNLLDAVPIPSLNVHPVVIEWDPVTSAREYESELREFFASGRGVPVFDMILLGMGEDGHTASLFPGTPSLEDDEQLVRAVGSDGARTPRITLTLPIINHGRDVVFLVSGAAKAGTARRVIEEGDPGLPASLVCPKNGGLLFLLDKGAASMLTITGVE